MKEMKETIYKATKKTWWITKGEVPMAGSIESGCVFETANPVEFFTVETKWESAKKKINNLTVIEEVKKSSGEIK